MKALHSAIMVLCALMCTEQCSAVMWFKSLEEYKRWLMGQSGELSTTTQASEEELSGTTTQVPDDELPTKVGGTEVPAEWLWLFEDEDNIRQTTTIRSETTESSHRDLLPQCCAMGRQAAATTGSRYSCHVSDYTYYSKDRLRNRGYGYRNNARVNAYRQSSIQHNPCISSGVRALTHEFQRCCKEAHRQMGLTNGRYIVHLPSGEHNVGRHSSRYAHRNS